MKETVLLLLILLSLTFIGKADADVQECIAGNDCYLIYIPSNKTDSNSPITDLSETTADFYYLFNDNGTTGTQLSEAAPDNINVYQIGATGNYKLMIPSGANIVTSGNAGKTLCVYVSGYANITTNRVACVYIKTKTDENTVARMPSSGSLPITTTPMLVSGGTGTGQVSLSSGAVLLQPTQTGVTIPTVTNVGTVTGNVNGSVASVSGAVGSVTGLTASDVGAIKTKTDYLPSATAGTSGGVLIAGSNSPTTFAGSTSTAGLTITGGTTATGALSLVGGSTSGSGLSVTTTSGDGFSITPTGGNGIVTTGNGTSKHGIFATGGTAGTSDGIKALSGTGGVDLRANQTGDITGAVSGSVASVSGSVNSVATDVGITQAGADKAWGTATRTLTAGTNIALAKGTGVTGFNDLSSANVSTAVWDAATASYGSAGSYGLLAETDLDATISSRSTLGGTAQTGDAFGIVNNGTYGNSAIKGYVDDIGVAGAGLTALGDTRIANLDATVSSRVASNEVKGYGFTTATGTTQATLKGANTGKGTDFYKGSVSVFTSGPCAGASGSSVTAYNTTTGDITITNLNCTPTAGGGDAVALMYFGAGSGSTGLTAQQTADAVWNEDATAHQTQGTFGKTIGDPVADTDTIWGLVNTSLDATVSSRSTLTTSDNIGINWADITNPTTSQTLSGTTIGTTNNVTNGVTLAANQAVNVTQWSGAAVATPDTAGYPKVTIKDGTGIGEIDTASGGISHVILSDTITTYTGNTPQAGDAFARLGAPAGASVSADVAAVLARTPSAAAITNVNKAYDGTGYAGQAIKVTIDTANTDTWDTIQIDETGIITVDGQYVGSTLWCGTEGRKIVATDYQAAADDTITVEPGRPFVTAPAGLSTCYIGM